jgi:prickle
MAQLPNHKVPRLNSAGEKYREKQLMAQLPKQDLATSYCKHLGGNPERKAYDDFINSRNEVALDIGYVNGSLKSRIVSAYLNCIETHSLTP